MENEEKNELDEIVENTIKEIDEMPFGITDDEMENIEVVGDENESTN